MGSKTQKTAGRNATTYGSADQTSYPPYRNVSEIEGKPASIDPPGSKCYRSIGNQDGVPHKDRKSIKYGESQRHDNCLENDVESRNFACKTLDVEKSIPEQLSELLMTIIGGARGEEMVDALQNAGDYPPITRQSLSELDIQNIINNIKLRHDVNFDRDLSFRPNLDGTKGQEKLKASRRYWTALCAELKLYMFLFQNIMPNGLPSNLDPSWNIPNWKALAAHAKRRIPIMFETIRDVLKSLVPDRDQRRVDEHLDVAMLMQQIEKGVYDLVRLSQWLAHLLKEHCAPMRDEWVDRMVEWTKDGVSNASAESIVSGLRELLGILEAMKLDVANHQIRNLRVLLIEDTVNFEQNYHLGRFVQGRARIDRQIAQQWYSSEFQQCQLAGLHASKKLPQFQLEVFVRAVISHLFSTNPQYEFPETFYLDQDRLQNLKFSLHDLVMLEVCAEIFDLILRSFGYRWSIAPHTRNLLRNELLAILGDGPGHSIHQWMANFDHISLQIVRRVWETCGRTHKLDLSMASVTSYHLRQKAWELFASHASILEASFVNQVLSCVNSHKNSSPSDLFNALVAPSNPPPPPPPSSNFNIPKVASDTLSPYPDQFSDLTNRISHIILLHWRTWGSIVYVPEDDEATPSPNSTSATQKETEPVTPRSSSTPLNPLSVDDTQASAPTITAAAGDPSGQDSQKETSLAGSTSEASTF